MTLTPDDIATLRHLVAAAKAAKWDHITYASTAHGSTQEHVWEAPERGLSRERVSYWHGALEYRERDAHGRIKSVLQVESVEEARRWLIALGLVEPTAVEVAEAVLSA